MLIALQFCPTDFPHAMRLARLIADIERTPRTDVEFCFAARFDCAPAPDAVKYLMLKFPVRIFNTTTRWTGWPGGPNGMARDVLAHAAREWAKQDGILLIEPDCVPMARDWIDQLRYEWSQHRCLMMGAWRDSGPSCGHINGNCIVSPDFADRVNLRGITQHCAWDCAIAPQVRHQWHSTGLILNRFQSLGAEEEVLKWPDEGVKPPVLVHGFKDDSAYDIAVKKLL